MATFPTTLPSITRITSPTDQYMDEAGFEIDLLHNQIAEEIEALASAVGVTGSAVPGTVENRLSGVLSHGTSTNNPHSVTKSQVGLGNCDNTSDENKPVSMAQSTAIAAAQAAAISGSPVQSVAGKTGTVTLAKADVGLGNVDNTSDTNKPVSSAQSTAIAAAQAAAISACPAETTTTIGSLIAGAGAKAAVAAADLIGISSVSDSNLLKKSTLQNLLDSMKLLGIPFSLRFPTWPANTGIMLASLVAGATASRTSNIVTISATGHGITTGAQFVGCRFFYPGSSSLSAGMYDSILSIPDANTLTFSATGSNFGSESINGGAAWVTTTDLISTVIPGGTFKDQTLVTVITSRDGGTSATSKYLYTSYGGGIINANSGGASCRGVVNLSFTCIGSFKQYANQSTDNILSSSTYTQTKDTTADQAIKLQALVNGTADFLVVWNSIITVRN